MPNVTIEYVHMVSEGAVALRRKFQWQGTTYAVSGLLLSQADLKDGGIETFWNAVGKSVIAMQTGFEMQWCSLHLPFAGTVADQKPVSASYAKEVTVGPVSWLPLIDVRLAFHLPWYLNRYVKASYLRIAVTIFTTCAAACRSGSITACRSLPTRADSGFTSIMAI